MRSVLQSVREQLQALPLCAFAAGDTLFAAGTRSNRLMFLETGRVAVMRDQVVVSRLRQPGAVFGEMSLLLDLPHTADVVAIEPTGCRVVEQAGSYLLERPQMMAYVAAILAYRLDAATRYLVDVKSQFAGTDTHLDMIDEVLESLANRHPRRLMERTG